MQTNKSQSNTLQSLKTSTPISENLVLPPFKQKNLIKPSNGKKKRLNFYPDFWGTKKRSKNKRINPSGSFYQDNTNNENCKENLITPSCSNLNMFTPNISERSKTSALKPLNAFKKCDKISDVSPIYPEPWRSKRYRSSHQNSNYGYSHFNKDVILFDKSKNQNSRSFGDANFSSRISLPSYAKVGSPFLSARNDHDVKVANRNENDISINVDGIFRNNFIARNKCSVFHKIKDTVRSETSDEITERAMPKPSNSIICKKVRFSDRIELFEDLNHSHLNSKNILNKKDKSVIDPYGLKELLEFFEDNRTLINEKKPKITTDGPPKTKRTSMKEIKKIEDPKKYDKKFTEDGSISNGDKIPHAKRIKMKDSRNSKKEKDKVNITSRKTHHSKKKKCLKQSGIDKESLDKKINVSVALNMIRNYKLSLDTENKIISSKLYEKEEHLKNDEILQGNILNGREEIKKNDTIVIEDFKNCEKSEKKRKVDDGSKLITNQTKVPVIDNIGESKQKEGETLSNVLESLEDTILYPSTSTPFDSPQTATNGLSLNFQRLSPIHENQPAVVGDEFIYFEPSGVYTEKTYSKRELNSISKSDKLWSLISTTNSIDPSVETISITASVQRPKEPEENSEDITLFETPPVKIVSGGSIDDKRQDKEAENNKKIRRFHKETKHRASKRAKRKPDNKITTDKRESISELSILQSHLSQHFEDVSGWDLCIEKKEHKRKFFTKENE